MSRWESWAFGALHAVLTLTGGVYFVMKYALRNNDPFAVINHPWQPSVLTAHVLAAPFGMVAFGIVFRSHILTKLNSKNGRGRRSGWTSLISFSAMALSGYLLQTVASPTWLPVMTVAHVATSIVFVAGYTTHLVGSLRLLRARRPIETEGLAGTQTSLPT